MRRAIFAILTILACVAAARALVVVDSVDGTPMMMASVFDANGTIVGMTDDYGNLPDCELPVTVRYIGYQPLFVNEHHADTLRMTMTAYLLPEVSVVPTDRPVTRMVVYVREYATLASKADTIDCYFDYMGNFQWAKGKVKTFKGSDRNFRRSSTDYRGYRRLHTAEKDTILPAEEDDVDFLQLETLMSVPYEEIRESWTKGAPADQTDTVRGVAGFEKLRFNTSATYNIVEDLLADKEDHRWTPWFLKLLGLTTEFTAFKQSYVYPAEKSGIHQPETLLAHTFAMEATGRGKWFKKAFRSDDAVELRFYYEIYPVEVVYMSADEWREFKAAPVPDEFRIPALAPELPDYILDNLKAAR